MADVLNPYVVFYPNGDVAETAGGVPSEYRKEGAIAHMLHPEGSWFRWEEPTWQILQYETLPAWIKAHALIAYPNLL